MVTSVTRVRTNCRELAVLVAFMLVCVFDAAADNTINASSTLPPTDGGPVVVAIDFELEDIFAIHDEDETFDFEGMLTLRWRDDRLARDVGSPINLYQGAYQIDEVSNAWYPQVLIRNQYGDSEPRGMSLRIAPDGAMELSMRVFATAKSRLAHRRFPFDRQQLGIVFELSGLDATEAVLRADSEYVRDLADADIVVRQWLLERIIVVNRLSGAESSFVVTIDARRNPMSILRLIVFPLIIIVILSWSVFWMDRSSVGDRSAVSFVGILTAVTFMMLINELLPKIAYATWLNAMVNGSFMLMAATVGVNLRVGLADRQGRIADGDRIDRRCRWLFPLVYVGLIVVSLVLAFVFF